MAGYLVADRTFDAADPELQAILPQLLADKLRPLCDCRSPGVPMYVAKVNGRFVVKRMPDSGDEHAPACDSYEPPAELSGIGQVLGSAVQEDPEEGCTSLKLDFSLTKTPGRAAPVSSGASADSVRTDGTKLTLRGLLHLLWEHAGFNRWSPAMAGKRTWWVIRKHLLAAAEDKATKGAPLLDVLFVPEQFNADRKHEIEQRCASMMARIAASEKGARRLMLAVGEVKEIAPARFGHKLILKHLPDRPLMLNDDLYKRLLKRFELELGLWNALEGTHLVLMGTFGVGTTGVAALEELTLMNVNEGWIPFESTFDKMLLDALTWNHRRFTKCLRYNLAATKPLACAVLADAVTPTALYVLVPGTDDATRAELDCLVDGSKLDSCVWEAGTAELPELPPPVGRNTPSEIAAAHDHSAKKAADPIATLSLPRDERQTSTDAA